MAERGATSDPDLANILLAQTINRLCGTTLGPWDVAHLDDATLDTIKAIAFDLPGLRAQVAEVEAVKERIRQEFRQRNKGYLH